MAQCPVCQLDLGIKARRGQIDGFNYRPHTGRSRFGQGEALVWACPGCKSLLWKTGTGPALLSALVLVPQIIFAGITRYDIKPAGATSTPWLMFYAVFFVSGLVMAWCVYRMRFPLKPVPFMSSSRARRL